MLHNQLDLAPPPIPTPYTRTRQRFRRIDDKSRVIVAIDLAALELLQPAVVRDVRDGDAARGIGVQHCEEDAPEGGRVDVLVEEGDVRVV